MGWLFYAYSKKEIVDELTKTAIVHTVRGNTLYGVFDRKDGGRIIGIFLLGVSSGRWGYKDMDETMGAYQYDCPLSYLDMSTTHEGYADDWKAKVRAHHAKKAAKRKIGVGDTVQLIDGCRFGSKPLTEVTITAKRGATLLTEINGCIVRIPPRHIKGVI